MYLWEAIKYVDNPAALESVQLYRGGGGGGSQEQAMKKFILWEDPGMLQTSHQMKMKMKWK